MNLNMGCHDICGILYILSGHNLKAELKNG